MKSGPISAIAATTVLAGAIAAAVAAPQTNRINPLRVSMTSLGSGQVEVVVTNTSRKSLRIPKWQLPTAALESNLFSINRNGEPIRFEGRMVKRAVPTAADFAILYPGRSHRAIIDLRAMYALTKAGHYTVTFNSSLQYASLTGRIRLTQQNGLPIVAQSAPIIVALDVQASAHGPRIKPVLPSNPELSDVVGISTANCNATQIDALGKAILSARSMTEYSKRYLNAGAVGPRYTSWFGAYTSARYATAQQHFVAIDNAMDQVNGQITINCGCTDNIYAYVFKSQHYQIWVCNAFWSAPLIGTDSRAGTLIHEMSHFDIVTSTDDHVYGQTGARNLAITNPTNALDNADSHEYFAENTPAEN